MGSKEVVAMQEFRKDALEGEDWLVRFAVRSAVKEVKHALEDLAAGHLYLALKKMFEAGAACQRAYHYAETPEGKQALAQLQAALKGLLGHPFGNDRPLQVRPEVKLVLDSLWEESKEEVPA